MNCPFCRAPLEHDAIYCHQCGKKLDQRGSANPSQNIIKTGLDIGWIFKSAVIMVLTSIGVSLLMGLVLGALSVDHTELNVASRLETEPLLIVILLGVINIFTMFLGALLAAYFSPGTTIKEPAIAAVLLVSISNLLLTSLTTAIIGAIIPYFVALAGAKIGEKMQAARKKNL